MEFEQLVTKKSQPSEMDSSHPTPQPKPKQTDPKTQKGEIEARLVGSPTIDGGELYVWLSVGSTNGVTVGPNDSPTRGHIKGIPGEGFSVAMVEEYRCYVRFDKGVPQDHVTGGNTRYVIDRK